VKIRIITASAGSGKTHRLTLELDQAIASGRARPEGIVATTFTRQAAAELVERARTRMLRTGRAREAQQILAARIGTVNSVCGSLVSDFAFELGMSPAVRVLDEGVAELEFRRALACVVTSDRADELEGFPARFDAQLDWRFEVRRIIEAARANGIAPADIPECAERSVRELDACMGPCARKADLDGALGAALEAARRAIEGGADATKGTADYVELLRSAMSDLERRRLRWGDWARLSTAEPRKKSLAHAARVQKAALRHLEHPRMRSEMHRLIRLLFEVAADGLTAYQAYKRERGVIDFVDQETLALQLLGRDEIRAELAGQIDLVMVDEFQDTSPIQLAIFLQLASLAAESIWVGDPKQAIFGFRGTDPALMDAAIESLTSTRTDPDLVNDAARAVSGGRVETLGTSYRSRPELVAVTSEIFARAFAHQGMPEERTRLRPHLVKEPPGLGRSVEYWPLDLPGRKNAATRADAMATGVRDFLARRGLVRDRDTGAVRAALHADLAVLCRTNKQCQEVAEALGALGVPAVVPRMGLLDTAEGQLLVAGLRLWVDPGDSLAAAEICRLVSHPEDLDGLVNRALGAPASAALRDDPTVVAVLAARERGRDLGPVAALDAVLDATGLRRHCAGWGNAAQRLANLDALRSHATVHVEEAVASGDPATLVGLLHQLETIGDDVGWDSSRADSQALLAGEDAVTVSTWHRAKGLEWPATILFGLEGLREPQAHGAHVMSDREAFRVSDPLGGRWIRFWPNPYTNAQQNGPVRNAFEASRAHASLVMRAEREALRVLYVGWTRARDRLILAAERGKLLGGLLGVLANIDPALIGEPDAAVAGEERVSWAGMKLVVGVGPREPGEPVAAAPVPGAITMGRSPRVRPRARQSPSALAAVTCSLGEIVALGEGIPLRGRPCMQAVGEAVHGFLAADRARRSGEERRRMATGLLERFGVAGSLDAADLVACASRLWGWLETRFPRARLHREWPVAERQAAGTVVAGTADLIVRSRAGITLIDHKTFTGDEDVTLDRALSCSGQLAGYASAIRAATGHEVASTWIHLPVLGRLVEVRPAGGAAAV